ncbi:hypothetical protein FIBSPDRAFT_880662 [Athelia psychrophila]|uniref:Uncharacterized protein n=1 Tax=Athelia psychrophila TaxID=1759441 RepID=A0A167SIV3_9AGAM|nr:hypothetical protein FIBSPDRAFT_880662 [Fibularhizoctonia sp. CBS 109695]
MPLVALEVKKSSASGPGSGFKADQSAGDESRVLRLAFFDFSARQLCSGSGAGGDTSKTPRERPQYTDPQLCIAIRLPFALLCCLSGLLRASGASVGFIAAIVRLNQETHDEETEARPPCLFQDDVEATCLLGSCAIISQALRT